MTIHNDKSALPLSPNHLPTLYPITYNNHHQHHAHNNLREPDSEYTVNPNFTDLRDKLEQHLAHYHFHQLSLLALSSHDDYKDNDDWHFGAYLAGRSLQQISDQLMEQLSQVRIDK